MPHSGKRNLSCDRRKVPGPARNGFAKTVYKGPTKVPYAKQACFVKKSDDVRDVTKKFVTSAGSGEISFRISCGRQFIRYAGIFDFYVLLFAGAFRALRRAT